MGVPDHLLVHTVTVVEPAQQTDAYQNTTYDYGAGATRIVLEPGGEQGGAWLQQDQRTEQFSDGRDPLDQRWLMVANYAPISGHARIEWADHPAGPVVFHVDGPTEPAYTPAGFHHTELMLRITEG